MRVCREIEASAAEGALRRSTMIDTLLQTKFHLRILLLITEMAAHFKGRFSGSERANQYAS